MLAYSYIFDNNHKDYCNSQIYWKEKETTWMAYQNVLPSFFSESLHSKSNKSNKGYIYQSKSQNLSTCRRLVSIAKADLWLKFLIKIIKYIYWYLHKLKSVIVFNKRYPCSALHGSDKNQFSNTWCKLLRKTLITLITLARSL